MVDNYSYQDLLSVARRVDYNATVSELIEESLRNHESRLSDKGALCALTGKHTGRSPKDRFIVDTPEIHDLVHWSSTNQPCSVNTFERLYAKMKEYAKDHQLFVRDAYVGADPAYRMQVKCINEYAWHQLFLRDLFIRPTEKVTTPAEFTVVCMPSVKANPVEDGTHSETFIIVNFNKKMVLIGGGAYAGEMKKSIFSVMNFILPQKNVLSMHCSANIGKDGKSALFFGLSGTGKTTLSADPNRKLIGDDEHGWSEHGIFNIEGGCYAKMIRITPETEPEIYNAITYGTVMENVVLDSYTREPDFFDAKYTQNTRGAYPIENIPNAVHPSIGGHPTAIVFLTADAFGVLPPISKLTKEQAMYHFLSGYTSKIPGTERGVTEPKATFSIGFGEPFFPLSPLKYARLLGEKINQYNTSVYLVNTGWSGGPYGVGKRMELKYTRAMITAALDGKLDGVEWKDYGYFQLCIPDSCPNVPSEVLNPENTWADKKAYHAQAEKLVKFFAENVRRFKGEMPDDILNAGPRLND